MPPSKEFPYQDGDVTVLGPEVFASDDGRVICWKGENKGENYVPQKRLRLAHQARRAKEHQLDDVRRALCDIGFMEDDDPYSHADLANVIRQNGQATAEPERCCGKPAGAVCVHDVSQAAPPSTPTQKFIPPAAEGLPLESLESAASGATMIDAWAETGNGRNFLAHALVQLARDGWLRRTPEPEAAFDAVGERPVRPAPEPQEAP